MGRMKCCMACVRGNKPLPSLALTCKPKLVVFLIFRGPTIALTPPLPQPLHSNSHSPSFSLSLTLYPHSSLSFPCFPVYFSFLSLSLFHSLILLARVFSACNSANLFSLSRYFLPPESGPQHETAQSLFSLLYQRGKRRRE